jgi:hypothetical protein
MSLNGTVIYLDGMKIGYKPDIENEFKISFDNDNSTTFQIRKPNGVIIRKNNVREIYFIKKQK